MSRKRPDPRLSGSGEVSGRKPETNLQDRIATLEEQYNALILQNQKLKHSAQTIAASSHDESKCKSNIQDLKSQIRDKEREIEELKAGLKTRELELKTQELDIKSKETDITTRELEVENKEADIMKREMDLEYKIADMKYKDADLKNKEAALKCKEAEVKYKESEVKYKEAKVNHKGATLKNELMVKNKEAAMRNTEADLKFKDAEMKFKDAEMKYKDAELKYKDAEIKFREADTKFKEADIKRNEAELKKQEAKFKVREARIKQREKEKRMGSIMKKTNSETESLSGVRNKQELDAAKRTIKDLKTRLGKFVGEKVMSDNDTGAVAKRYDKFYDNDWTCAFLELFEGNRKLREQRNVVKFLLATLKDVYTYCQKIGKDYENKYVFIAPESEGRRQDTGDIKTTSMKHILELRRTFAPYLTENVYKRYLQNCKEVTEGKTPNREYVKSCVELCWLMSVQDPPVVLDIKDHEGPFDEDNYRRYTTSGVSFDYIVFPPMYLSEGGPLMRKGVAQAK